MSVEPDLLPLPVPLQERIKLIESKCRNRPVEESLRVWEEMKKGSEEGLTNAMRFKINMKVSPSPSDPLPLSHPQPFAWDSMANKKYPL